MFDKNLYVSDRLDDILKGCPNISMISKTFLVSAATKALESNDLDDVKERLDAQSKKELHYPDDKIGFAVYSLANVFNDFAAIETTDFGMKGYFYNGPECYILNEENGLLSIFNYSKEDIDLFNDLATDEYDDGYDTWDILNFPGFRLNATWQIGPMTNATEIYKIVNQIFDGNAKELKKKM